ncbi:MAG TPA: DNA polymerase [Puia sp.]|nr:DNA polymerase [Puia sp.]
MTREWINDPRNRKYNPVAKGTPVKTPRLSPGPKPFGTMDGEGGNIDDPNALFGTVHAYQLLRADEFQISNKEGLHYSQCFDFISSLPKNRIWTGYFFDYDVTMMCRGLSEERARRLFDPTLRINSKTGMAFQTIDVDDKWDIGYLPHKFFKVRRKEQNYYIEVSDTGTFFQTSFVNTLRKWDIATPDELEMIIKGKSMRADFTDMDAEIEAYNTLECMLHNKLMETFRDVCTDIGYVPKKWQGPGHLAAAFLSKHGVPKRDDIPIMNNWKFRELANAAYYGGRAETTVVGNVPGPVYQWDINGAYVAALRHLPCLVHGSWKYVHTRPDLASIWVGNVTFAHDAGRLLFNLPVRRKDGNIFFPRFGGGHYWSWELNAAVKAGTHITGFIDGWVYEKHCDCKPFDWVDDIYQQRLRIGKSGKGIILKLGTNSIYGKIAQSIGYAPWANPVWAGLITAYTRAKIITAYRRNPNDVLMIMTDGIFLRHKPDLPESKKLGEWELKVHEHMFVIQPGVYFLPDDVKTRGAPHGRIVDAEPQFRETFEKFTHDFGIPMSVAVPVDNFITMRLALARHKWHTAGTWEHTMKEISFDWTNKRQGSGLLRETDTGVFRTLPIDSDVSVLSLPYDRVIGGEMQLSPFDRYSDSSLEDRISAEEQPDWEQRLIDDV